MWHTNFVVCVGEGESIDGRHLYFVERIVVLTEEEWDKLVELGLLPYMSFVQMFCNL